MTQELAERMAHSLFDTKATHVDHVQLYSLGEWRDGGWKGFRVSMNDGTLHWLSWKGRHEEEVCCKRQTTVKVEHTVEVVRR